MWMDFMKVALQGVPDAWPERPPGLVTVRIDPETGKLAAAGAPEAIFEMVPAELVPAPAPDGEVPAEGERQPGEPEEIY
jgi:penicillin-binding protein 1A